MNKPNYRQGFMAGLIMLVFFGGEAIGSMHGPIAVVGAGATVGIGVALGLLILRSGAQS